MQRSGVTPGKVGMSSSRRQERQAQQPLRAARLHRVVKVEPAWPIGRSFWIDGGPHLTHGYLIIQTADKSLHLWDPGQASLKMKPLGVAPECPFRAFCLPDGRLRIAELVPAAVVPMFDICWHTISLTTSSMLVSEPKHHWKHPLLGLRLRSIHHARSGKVVSFVDSHTLAIMHADTLQEITRCDLSRRHPQHLQEAFSQVDDLGWSHSGSMLATVLYGRRHVTPAEAAGDRHACCRAGPPLVSEVHVYDASNGHCLQSIGVSARDVTLHWSPSADVLAVHSHSWEKDWGWRVVEAPMPQDQASQSDSKEDDEHAPHEPSRFYAASTEPSDASDEDTDLEDEDDSKDEPDGDNEDANRCRVFLVDEPLAGSSSSSDDEAPAVKLGWGHIRLLRPLSGQVHLLDCVQAEHCQAQWSCCEWSPGGHLLGAHWVSNSAANVKGFAIIDPVTYEEVYNYEVEWPAKSASWAEQPSSSSQGPCLVAFHTGNATGARKCIRLSRRQDGCWTASPCTWFGISTCGKIFISPDGQKLVGLQFTQQAFKPDQVCHFAVSLAQEQPLGLEGPNPGGDWSITFAPFPPAWPAIYAYLHSGDPDRSWNSSPLLQLSMVDCKRNMVIGSWTSDDLWQQSTGQQLQASGQDEDQPELRSARWSPDGKHLAVFCDSCTMVMTFQAAAESC